MGKVTSIFSAVVLAAGESSRMREPKHLLKYDDNRNFMDIIAESFISLGCEQVVFVLNPNDYNQLKNRKLPPGVTLALNSTPSDGRFSSLKVGLKALKRTGPVFVHNVDNPFVMTEPLLLLAQKVGEYDYIKPMFKGEGGHPVLISEKVVGAITRETGKKVHLRDFLSCFSKIGVEVTDKNILTNINSLEDYRNLVARKQD